MIELKPRGEVPVDPDGVRVTPGNASAARRTKVFQTLALLFAAGCVGYIVTPRGAAPGPAATRDRMPPADVASSRGSSPASASSVPLEVAGGTVGAAPAAAVSTRSATPRRKATQRPSQDPPEEPSELPIPNESLKNVTAGEYIQALHDAGIYSGIGAFPPPGTSPPLAGLAVPEDYELPEGYVRHHQTTDDGQDIEPILMYSPDYEFFDANGQPIPIPEDRVVPPELAPPGVPIRPIQIPEPRESEGQR